ncbi:MAG: GGDEF domain-containing protein [Alcaligenaceae bacterium]|nr:GGDEF domain-containing protein [Alcaligenaceae bacterium]
MSGTITLNSLLNSVSAGPDRPPDGLLKCLDEIIRTKALVPVFQPIARIQQASLLGHEGLIRGPADSPLYLPDALFRTARSAGRSIELELLCCRMILQRSGELGLPKKIFINISPSALIILTRSPDELSGWLAEAGLEPGRVVFEVTEQRMDSDPDHLIDAVAWCRVQGIQIAIDDLGIGYSSLSRWLDLKPEFIKADKRFVRGLETDPARQQLMRSLCDMAKVTNAQVIVEGIEAAGELDCLAALGIGCGQGFHIARPQLIPTKVLAPEIVRQIERRHAQSDGSRAPHDEAGLDEGGRVLQLLRQVPSVKPTVSNYAVSEVFRDHPQLHTIPVVDQGIPVGVITRSALIERFARPYQRELFGSKPCSLIMDDKPVITDKNTPLATLSRQLVQVDGYGLANDFIIAGDGQYLGIGTSQDLLRALNEMQIRAARHANPLTQLPGNVPIRRQIQHLLNAGRRFAACYADLDQFKPFNDVFGYQRGDEVIQLTGSVLTQCADPELDFVGHIGGDDFLILFRSEDWAMRCQMILDRLVAAIHDHMQASGDGGDFSQRYIAKDRIGNQRRYALPSLSLGIVSVEPGQYDSHHQIAQAATEAKFQAKKLGGNTMAIDRRQAASRSRIV